VHRVECGVEGGERLAQCQVEGVDRAVAIGGGVEDLAVHLHLHARLGPRKGAVAALHDDREVDDPEGRHVVRVAAPDEELEGGIRALEAGALRLELLHDA
jgi:hypothetical protein